MSRAAADERAPLLANEQARQDEDEALAAAAASSFSVSLDPNASAFAPPSHITTSQQLDKEGEALRPDRFLILGGLWIGTFLAALDGTIVATVLASIGSDLHRSNQTSWIGTSYLLTQCAFQPLYGRGSDIFGRKPATLFASIVFLIGSLACGLSKSFPQLIAARALAGIGGGGLTTMASIVTSDLIPLHQRGVYQGFGNIVYALGAAIGGPLGGLFSQTIGWQAAFLIQVPLCILHSTVVTFKVDIPSGPGSVTEKLKRIDYFGALSLVSAIALFLMGTSMGGNEFPWGHPIVVGSIVASVALLGVFVAVEKYVAREPVMPLRVLFTRTPGFVALTNWFISMSQFGIIFQIPLYFQAALGQNSSLAGLHLIPNAVLASTASLLCGIYIARTGSYKTMLVCLASAAVIGPLCMSLWNRVTTPAIAHWLSMIPGGLGFGGIITVTLVALIAAVPPEDTASAIGVSYLFRATGSVLGISVTSAILQASLKSELARRITGPDAAHVIESIRLDVEVIASLSPELQEAARTAYAESMQLVFICITVMAALAFICANGIGVHQLKK